MEHGRADTDLEMGGYLPNTLYAYDRRAPRLDAVQSLRVTRSNDRCDRKDRIFADLCQYNWNCNQHTSASILPFPGH